MFLDLLGQSLDMFRRRKTRTALTMLGTFIATLSTVLVFGLINGFSQKLVQQVEALGSKSYVLSIESTPSQLQPYVLAQADYDVLAALREVMIAVPINKWYGAQISSGGAPTTTDVVATTADFRRLKSYELEAGRFLLPSDVLATERVAVLGHETAERLSAGGGAAATLGTEVRIGGDWYRVVGVLARRGLLLGAINQDAVVYTGNVFDSATGLGRSQSFSVEFLLKNGEFQQPVLSRIKAALSTARSARGQEGSQGEYRIEDAGETAAAFRKISAGGLVVGVAIALISLIVGGVGITNIMYANISERTREIGILGALGADSTYILLKFLIEAVVLSVVGALGGLIVGAGIYAVLGAFLEVLRGQPIPAAAYVLSISFALITGLIAGIAPARKAASANIIDALRSE